MTSLDRLDSVELAGIDVARELVHHLADMLTEAGRGDTAAVILVADASGHERVGLTIEEREIILSVLDGPPDGLLDLRAVLLNDHAERLRNGLTET